MDDIERFSLAFPADVARMIREEVEQGRSASESDAVVKMLRAWRDEHQHHASRLSAIRAKIEEADRDPRPSLTAADVDRHFEERLRRSLASQNDA